MPTIDSDQEDSEKLTLLLLDGKIKGISWSHKFSENQIGTNLAQMIVRGDRVVSYVDFNQIGVKNVDEIKSHVSGIPFREILGQDAIEVMNRLGAENVTYEALRYLPPESIRNFKNN